MTTLAYTRTASRRMPRWYEWLIALVLLIAVATHFVIRPLAERLLVGAGQVVFTIFHGAAIAVQGEYELARWQIEHDPQIAAQLGAPVRGAPIEQVQWESGGADAALVGTFVVVGSRGSGEARITLAESDGALRTVEIAVIADDACWLIPPP